MLTVYSDRHHDHDGDRVLVFGALQANFDRPARADNIVGRIREIGLGPVIEPDDHGLEAILKVHDDAYVRFLREAAAAWQARGNAHALSATMRAPRRAPTSRKPANLDLDASIGHYLFDTVTPLTPTTWPAVYTSAQVALSGAAALRDGERAVFSLCRPPGHHAGRDYGGGYCYLNNAGIAAQAALDHGARRVAILDVDYHHGNGTQDLFYTRDDVLFISIHADPRVDFPYFTGFADETGEGTGAGCNRNYPLPHGTAWPQWCEAFEAACAGLAAFAPDVLVISLGVDTYQGDPIAQFRLGHEHYSRIGERLAALALPTHFVMEGGYALDAIGLNVTNLLSGFEQQAS